MKNKKWIIILVFVIILIIVLAISLTKCGKESQKAKGKNNETENVATTKAGTKAKKAVSSGQAENGKPAEAISSGETVTPGNEAAGSTPASGEGNSGSEGGTKTTTSPAATPASSGTSSHTHSYGAWVNNQNGTKTRSCSCGDVEITSATWVVDQPAWTETVNKTRTETRYRPTWWINVNGLHLIYYSESEQEAKLDELDSQGIPSSWGNGEDEAYTVEVPYTDTIEHPEVGHWE